MRRLTVGAAAAAGVVVGVVAVTLVALAGDPSSPVGAAADDGGAPARTITVEGVGRVEGEPDVLTVELGVRTTAPSAREALTRANERAAALLELLAGRGVAERDIRTSALSVHPEYDREGRQITGYAATNTVSARLRDLDRAGEVIDAAADAVGEDIVLHGVAFSIEDTGALVAAARREAVDAARAAAGQLAEAAGVRVGEVLSVVEGSRRDAIPYERYAAADTAAGGASVPLASGSQPVELRVTVTFALG